MRQSSDSDIRAGAWGVAAGLVGSLCCIGPSAAVLLGLGSSSALFGLALDRGPALIGGAALLLVGLGAAMWHARACQLRAGARWRAPALMLASCVVAYGLLGLLAPILAAREEELAAAPASARAASVIEAPVAAASPRRLTLTVEKMYCPPCASHVRSALRRQPAVRDFVAEVDVDQVTIDYDSSRISAKKLIAIFPASYGITQLDDRALQ
jgi:copper chaperone CopZ